MKFKTDYTVEKYALNATWRDFPSEVKEHAKMCAIDLIAALILGSYGRQFKAGQKVANRMGFLGNIPIIGSTNMYNLLGATIVMGHASNSFDIDDGHRLIQGHPGTSFIAGTLAAAISNNKTVLEFLEALVVCYELTIRWAIVMQKEYNFLHSTGAYGAFGTALGIGRLLGLSKEQLNNTLSIADYHAPMTPVMRAVEYPSMNKDGVPFGALTGVMAVLETLCGSTGKTHLLEKDEHQWVINDLGQKYHILDLYFKPYTCCRWAHQPIQAIIDLKKRYSFKAEDVKEVNVKTFRSATLLSKKQPSDSEEAQYNIAFPIACALVYGDVGFMQVRDEALNNTEVLEAMNLLHFVEYADYEEQFPHKRLASVKIILHDGNALESGIYEAPGEPDDPNLGLSWIIKKFNRVTSHMLDSHSQEQIIDAFINKTNMSINQLINDINKSLKKGI